MQSEAGRRPIPLGLLCLLLAGLLLAAVLLSLALGSSRLGVGESFRILAERLPLLGPWLGRADIADKYRTIVFDLRLPRIILSLLTGAGLAAVGAVFQAVFRNPLADPHILGLSSGAALGASLAIILGFDMLALGLGPIGLSAFFFALLSVGIVFLLAGAHLSAAAMTRTLLIGVALGTLCSSLISLLMLFHHESIERIYMWTLGSFNAANWEKVRFLFWVLLPTLSFLLLQGRRLNLLLAGEEEALSLGLDTVRIRRNLIIAASLIVAATVSVSGVIGFIGLIVPHVLRLSGQYDLRRQLPLSTLSGAVFLLLCDTFARVALAPVEIPVGVVTSVFGVPYFLHMVYRSRRRDEE